MLTIRSMRHLILAALLLLALPSMAATKAVNWIHPTTNVDGSALPVSSIVKTTVYWGASASSLTSSKVVTGTATSTTIDLAPGAWFVGAKTSTAAGDSAMSNVLPVTVPQPLPNPPVITVAEVVGGLNMAPVYRITAAGVRGTTVIGFAPVGTACSGPKVYTYRGRAYHRVSRSTVKWWGTSPTDEAAAACA